MNIMKTDDGCFLISFPVDFRSVCGRRRLIIADKGEVTDVDRDESNTLIRSFARARLWTQLLERGEFADIKDLAESLGFDRPYVVRILRLANLSPRILRAVISKQLPDGFTAERLVRIKSDLWEEQEREIGIA